MDDIAGMAGRLGGGSLLQRPLDLHQVELRPRQVAAVAVEDQQQEALAGADRADEPVVVGGGDQHLLEGLAEPAVAQEAGDRGRDLGAALLALPGGGDDAAGGLDEQDRLDPLRPLPRFSRSARRRLSSSDRGETSVRISSRSRLGAPPPAPPPARARP